MDYEYEEALQEQFIIDNGLDQPSKMYVSTTESLSMVHNKVNELEQILELKESERLNLEERLKIQTEENSRLGSQLADKQGAQSCMGCVLALFLFLVVPSLVQAGFQYLRDSSCNHPQSLSNLSP